MSTNLIPMKKSMHFLMTALFLLSLCYSARAQKEKKYSPKTKYDSIGYVIGINIGKNLRENVKRDSLTFENEALISGFRDALNNLDRSVMDSAQQQKVMAAFQQEMQQRMASKNAKDAVVNKEAGAKWLADNKKNEGVMVTPSGLQYKVIREGTGRQPTIKDRVTVHYEGRLIDGTVFDSSLERGEPATFMLQKVIVGWQEGVSLMKEGAVFELYIPSDLAYGDQGYPPNVPGGSLLIFKVELIKAESVE
jgi:FKBP-type peptidyl-prolyl cis-trans isomerase